MRIPKANRGHAAVKSVRATGVTREENPEVELGADDRAARPSAPTRPASAGPCRARCCTTCGRAGRFPWPSTRTIRRVSRSADGIFSKALADRAALEAQALEQNRILSVGAAGMAYIRGHVDTGERRPATPIWVFELEVAPANGEPYLVRHR